MIISEIKKIKVDKTCYDNPVYLCWLNTIGGWDYWLFSYNQEQMLTVGEVVKVEPYVYELEDALQREVDVSKRGQRKMRLSTGYITIDEVEGLRHILTSPAVYMLLNNATWQTEGPKWLGVIVEAGSWTLYFTRDTMAQVELTIEIPHMYTHMR